MIAEPWRVFRSGVLVLGAAAAVAAPLAGQQDTARARRDSAAADPRTPARQQPTSGIERQPLADRWRHLDPAGLIVSYSLLNPYGPNPLKGDVAVIGQNTFSVFTLAANPVAVVSSQQNIDPQFNNRVVGALEFFNGLTVFKPKTWSVKASAQGLFNRGNADLEEVRPLELFGEAKLFDMAGSGAYDFGSVRAGVQAFASDFNGLIFNDLNLGGRFFGEAGRNRYRWTLAGFSQRLKSPGNGITFDSRDQTVLAGNVLIEDFLRPGFVGQFSVHANLDRSVANNALNVFYLGFASDGHLGRLEFNPTLYFATGKEDLNPLAGQSVSVMAFLAGLEFAYRRNWLTYRAAAFVASGDSDPADDKATGFDAVLDNVALFGGPASFVIGGAQFGTRANSFLPANRVAVQGSATRANFVNPGIQLVNAGIDAVVSPKVFFALNYNFFRLFDPAVLAAANPGLANELGHEVNATLRFRAFLDENVVFQLGGAVFRPAAGGRQLLGSGDTVLGANFALALVF